MTWALMRIPGGEAGDGDAEISEDTLRTCVELFSISVEHHFKQVCDVCIVYCAFITLIPFAYLRCGI